MRLDVNNHLVVIGDMGRYQLLSLLMNGLLVSLFGAQMFVTVFTHYTPEFQCVDEAGEIYTSHANSSELTVCDIVSSQNVTDGVTINGVCGEYLYDNSIFTSTIVTEFDLICEKTFHVTMVNMAWMASEGVGAIIGSYLSDRFGRKPLIIATYLIIAVFGTASAFATNLVMYIVLKCVMGFICFAGFSAAVALAMESTSPHKRSHAINTIDVFWVLGSSSLSLWAYLIRDWSYLQMAISIPALPLGIACIWLLDESPHWLMANGKKEQALDVMNKMARINRVVAPRLTMKDHGLLNEKSEDSREEVMKDEKKTSEGCCDMWRYKRVTIRFFVFSAGWISCAFTYYALSFGVSNLPGNIFLNHFIMCAVEGLAYVACYSIAWIGRKGPTVGTYLGGALSLLISILLLVFRPESSMAVTVLSVIGKFFISAAWNVILVWQTEVYPTTLRCTLSAMNGVVGRIGTVTAPYMVDLHKFIDVPHEDVILPSIYVVMMVTVGLLHLIPPETNHKKLPETLSEANVISFPSPTQGNNNNRMEDDKLMEEKEMET